MAALLKSRDVGEMQFLEQRALERMLVVLCELIEQVRGRGDVARTGDSREAALQHAAFVERRDQARRAISDTTAEPHDVRVARLERLVGALFCSRDYFCRSSASNTASATTADAARRG